MLAPCFWLPLASAASWSTQVHTSDQRQLVSPRSLGLAGAGQGRSSDFCLLCPSPGPAVLAYSLPGQCVSPGLSACGFCSTHASATALVNLPLSRLGERASSPEASFPPLPSLRLSHSFPYLPLRLCVCLFFGRTRFIAVQMFIFPSSLFNDNNLRGGLLGPEHQGLPQLHAALGAVLAGSAAG